MVRTNTSENKVSSQTREHRGKVYHISEAHPAAEVWPWLSADDLQALADDICKHKQRLAILRLEDGRILDGRNRELACLIAGETPAYETVKVAESAIPALIESLNGHRRHMTIEQRRECVQRLRGQGMSTRKIAAQVGVNQATVVRDLKRGDADASPEHIDGADGKKYAPTRPTPAATPDTVANGVIADAKPEDIKDRIAEGRAKLDRVIQCANEAEDAMRSALLSVVGQLLERITVSGNPLIIWRTVRERSRSGTVERQVPSFSVAPAVVVSVLRRVHPKAVCAGCRGDGCVACKALGFVPCDESLIQDGKQLAFDFAADWDDDHE